MEHTHIYIDVYPIVHYCRSAFWLPCSNRSISMLSHGRLFLTIPLSFFEPSPKGRHLKKLWSAWKGSLVFVSWDRLRVFFGWSFRLFIFFPTRARWIMCMHCIATWSRLFNFCPGKKKKKKKVESSGPAKCNVWAIECPWGTGTSYTCLDRLVFVACHDSRLGNLRYVIVIWDLSNNWCLLVLLLLSSFQSLAFMLLLRFFKEKKMLES